MADAGEPFVEEPPTQYHAPEAEALMARVHSLISAARPVPLTSDSRIDKDEVLDLLEEAMNRLPEELKAARWLLKERDEYLSRAEHEAEEIIDQARARVERMVTRTEVVKAAEHRAYAIVDAAEVEARRMRHEVEDFCDQQLARFEVVLERTLKMVGAGREKLQTISLASAGDYLRPDDESLEVDDPPGSLPHLPPPPPDAAAVFFDQDEAG